MKEKGLRLNDEGERNKDEGLGDVSMTRLFGKKITL